MEASFPRRGKMGERMLYMKKFLSLLLVLGLLGSSQAALAAEESPAPLPGWSHSILADGYSLGLFGDEIGVQHSQTVTMEQVEALARTVGDKLALLDPGAPAHRRDRPGAGHHPGRRGERPVSGGRRLCLPRRGAGA